MRPLKLYFPVPGYASYRRTAQVYRSILERSCELLSDRDCSAADVVMLYGDVEFESIYQEWPDLARKYVVAYAVWEASDIPDPHKRSIERVREVWTCSRYCHDIFRRYHPSVYSVPHVVERDTDCSEEDLDFVKRAIAYEPGKVYFLIVGRRWGGRKNVCGLVRAFERLRSRMPDARLLVKVRAGGMPRAFEDPRIRWIAENWTERQLNALYRLSHVYVSPHFGEAWGLTLSDAMLFGKPVVATGYSGNLEFMHPGNSFLLDCDETEIRKDDQYALYSRPMKWGYPDEQDLDRKLSWIYEAIESEAVTTRVRQASEDIRRFDRQAIEPLIVERLQHIADTSILTASRV